MTYNPDSHSSDLTRFSLDRRITVLVLFLSILVVGVISTMKIPRELMPRGFESQSLQVFVPWNDAPSQEVLEKITLPLEEELSTVKGKESMNTFSQTGQSRIFIGFKHGTDLNVAYREVRDRVERARARFPEDVDRIFIRKEDTSGIPVAFIGLAIDPALGDYYDLIQKQVVLPLERVEGVASVTVNGLLEKEIIIEVDRERAESAGLNIFQLSQDLGGDNFTMASGHVEDSGKKFLLRSVATYANLTALENRMVAPSIRLKDIANIKYEEPDRRFSVRVNSRPAVAMIIRKEGEANTVEVSRRITQTVAELQKNPRLSGISMETLFNQGDIIEESIQNLLSGGRVGGLFAILVLFFFLRRLRLTLIITLSIPVSLLIALTTMYFSGETLNLLTMLALMICVGLLVDNSVVVAENIHRLHRGGMNRRQACIQGASEIALAIVMATLTTVIVFLPVSLIEGQAQFFLLRLSVPISISLLASLVVALVFVPLCVYLTLPVGPEKKTSFRRAHNKVNDLLRGAYDVTFEKLNHNYTRMLGFFLRHRADMIVVLLALMVITGVMHSKYVKVVGNQEEDQTSFEINVELSNEHSFDDAREYFGRVEKVLEQNKEAFGLDGYFIFHQTLSGQIQGWLTDEIMTRKSAKQIAEEMLQKMPEMAGVKFFSGNENEAETKEDNETFVVNIEGEDVLQLEAVASDIEPSLLRVPGVLGLKKGEDTKPNEMALVIDRDRAMASGVNPQWVAGVVNYAIRGSALPRYNENGREIPVRIRFEEGDRESLTEISDFEVPTQSGEFLPLSALTTTEMLNTAPRIFRKDKRVTRSITLDLTKEGADETRQKLRQIIAGIDLPEGLTFASGSGRAGGMDEDVKNLIIALMLSILFIYLLMGFLFEDFFLPFSIILTIPLAGIGVSWIHIIMNKDMDILGVVGAVLLVGVVVNNGIVLIDYVNRLRQDGVERGQALLLAAERRFRPIVITALTTIIGMVPLTISKPSSLGLSYKSFGLTLIGGMSTATLLTLLVIPIFYTLFEDLWNRASAVMRLAIKRSGGKADPAVAAPMIQVQNAE